MARRLVAIEWDNHQVRVAVATVNGQVVVDEAIELELSEGSASGESAEWEKAAGEQVARALAPAILGKSDVLIAVPRSSVELKSLSLPPAPDDELPDLVRFQAQRDFNALGDDWPLDYVPLDDDPTQSRTVLAAALPPAVVDEVKRLCNARAWKLLRLVLRPSAAASLFNRAVPDPQDGVRLIVDVGADEADLSVMVAERTVFMRTARLPSDVVAAPEQGQPLVAEIRRTLAAANNQLGDKRVEAIYLSGDGESHRALAGRIAGDLGLPTKVFDPWGDVQRGKRLKKSPPENPARFAALLGILADESASARPAIDFLNPRKKPAPKSQRGRWALYGGAAAAVVACAVGWVWMSLLSLDNTIRTLDEQHRGLVKQSDKYKEYARQEAELSKWTRNGVVWVDELEHLSRKFPRAENGMVTSLTIAPHAMGGQITIEGLVKGPEVVEEMVQALTDERHICTTPSTSEEKDAGQYAWRFKSLIVIDTSVALAPTASPPASAGNVPVGVSSESSTAPAASPQE
jgi:Tfp pilus assembly PilM family ATPase